MEPVSSDKLDLLYVGISLVNSILQAIGNRRNAKDTSARAKQSLAIALSACNVNCICNLIGNYHLESIFIFFGISLGCHNNTACALVSKFNLLLIKCSLGYASHNIKKICFEKR